MLDLVNNNDILFGQSILAPCKWKYSYLYLIDWKTKNKVYKTLNNASFNMKSAQQTILITLPLTI